MEGAGTDGTPPVVARDQRFDSPEPFGTEIVGGEFEYLRLGAAPFRGRLRQLFLGGTLLQHADDGPHITRGAAARGHRWLLWPTQGEPGAQRVNGVAFIGQDAALIRGGHEIYAVCPAMHGWAAIGVPDAEMESLREWAPERLASPDGFQALRLAAGPVARLAAVIETGARMAALPAALLPDARAAEALGQGLREAVAEALTVPHEQVSRPRALREAVRLVAQAEAFLDAQRHRPVFVAELGAALGCSPRNLQNAFLAVVGTSPHAYLKRRRLSQARAALRRSPARPGRVKAVALDHGFWHLGHFALDYRALFGESPSDTPPDQGV